MRKRWILFLHFADFFRSFLVHPGPYEVIHELSVAGMPSSSQQEPRLANTG